MSTWLAPFLTQQLVILRGVPAQDQYGNIRITWVGATTATVPGYVYATVGAEDTVDQQREQADALAFVPSGTDVNNQDRIDIGNGNVFEVVGVRDLRHYQSGIAHMQLSLRQVIGAGRG